MFKRCMTPTYVYKILLPDDLEALMMPIFFRNSTIKKRFDDGEFIDCVLVGDNDYVVQCYVITTLLNSIMAVETLFNESQISTQNPIELSYGVWKYEF